MGFREAFASLIENHLTEYTDKTREQKSRKPRVLSLASRWKSFRIQGFSLF